MSPEVPWAPGGGGVGVEPAADELDGTKPRLPAPPEEKGCRRRAFSVQRKRRCLVEVQGEDRRHQEKRALQLAGGGAHVRREESEESEAGVKLRAVEGGGEGAERVIDRTTPDRG